MRIIKTSNNVENPYATESNPERSVYRSWGIIGKSFLLSLSFLASTIVADNLPDKTNHPLWFPLSVYSLPFTIPGMILVHIGYNGLRVYVISFFTSFVLSVFFFIAARTLRKPKRQ